MATANYLYDIDYVNPDFISVNQMDCYGIGMFRNIEIMYRYVPLYIIQEGSRTLARMYV